MDASHVEPLFRSMFHIQVPLAEKLLRPIVVYLVLVVLLRIFGKRELAQLNSFDLVVLLSLSNTVQNAIIGEDNSITGGLIGALSLLLINNLNARLIYGNRKMEETLTGSPTRLITNGEVDRGAMKKEMMTDADLLAVLHRQGFDDASEVANCTLEPGGGFFIKGTKPDADDRSHAELMGEMAKLQTVVADLRNEMRNRVN